MGVKEQALTRLAERQSEERAMVRTMAKRLDTAHAASEAAREALARAEAAEAQVLVQWVRQPGWSAEAVAEHTGLSLAEVNAATRAKRDKGSRRPGQVAATAGGPR